MSTGRPAEKAPQEIELRLFAEPDVLDALDRDPVLQNGLTAAIKRKHQVGTYFDTSDRRLDRRGVNFRVRHVGGAYVQTVKANGAATPLSRSEWESTIEGPEPDLAALAATGATQATGVLLPGDLSALFVTDVNRTVRTIAYDAGGDNAALIEVSADRGRVHLPGEAADGRSTPISELELELQVGPVAALFDLALALSERHALRVGFAGKAARGYALLSGAGPEPVLAEKLALQPSWTVDIAMGKVFRACFDQWIANERPAEAGTDPEGVHQMRVALRRLRTALGLFKTALPEDQRTWLNQEAKWLAGCLGPARDWDVFLDQMLPAISGDGYAKALAPMAKAAKARRRAGYRKARQAIGSPRYTRFLLEFWRWLEGHAWRSPGLALQGRPVIGLADAIMARQHRHVLKRGKGFADLGLPERHEVRIAVKKLRYSVEFFASLYPPQDAKPYRKHLAKFQDALGAMNDAAVAETLLDDVLQAQPGGAPPAGLARAAGLVSGWYTRGRIDQDSALITKWESFRETAPFWHTKDN